MMRISDDEYILRTYIESERREAAKAAVKKVGTKNLPVRKYG